MFMLNKIKMPVRSVSIDLHFNLGRSKQTKKYGSFIKNIITIFSGKKGVQMVLAIV